MGDIGEKAALDLVQFLKFLIILFKDFFVFIQLKVQGKLTKPQAIKEVIAGDNGQAGEPKEIKIIENYRQMLPSASQNASGGIHQKHTRDREQGFANAPMHDHAD